MAGGHQLPVLTAAGREWPARRPDGRPWRCLRPETRTGRLSIALNRGRRYAGVTAYVGLPGSGKTYSLAERALRALHQYVENGNGELVRREVWTNAGFLVRCPGCGAESTEFDSFDMFTEIPNDAVICWDELPLFCNSRKWQEFPDGLMYRLTQIRKDGLELYYSTIDWSMVDKNVRNITFWVWECTGRKFRPGHTARRFPPEERRRRDLDKKPRQVVRVDPLPEVFASYDTLSKVAAPAGKSTKRSAERWTRPGSPAPPAEPADGVVEDDAERPPALLAPVAAIEGARRRRRRSS